MLLYLSYGGIVLGLILVMLGLPIEWLRDTSQDLLGRQKRSIEDSLDDLGLNDYTAGTFLLYMLVFAIVCLAVTWIFTDNPYASAIVGIAGFFSYHALFIYLRQQREKEFEERFPMALDQLVSTARAGLNLSQSMEEVSKYAPRPVSDELQRIVKDQKLGSDIGSALIAAKDRMNSHTLSLTVSALLINIQQGGNLPEALEKISRSLKEIWRLEQKLFTASAEARKGAMVISCMPLVIFLMVLFMQPDMIETLTGSMMGYGVLTISAILYAAGIAWMIRIIKVDI
jgi:tight adherence protein B